MTPKHLLDQAERLCQPAAGLGRPRNADLRRSVSACYYAVFHALIEEACLQVVGTSREQKDVRDTLARAFDHGEMRGAATTFKGGTLPKVYAGSFEGGQVPVEVKRTAEAFLLLQGQRHAADYDRSAGFDQTVALSVLNLTRSTLELISGLRGEEYGRLFLLSLLIWKKLGRR